MVQNNAPLAFRMRPRTLAEYIGQEHIVGKGTALQAAIASDQLSSIILSGPPGTGKTSLAEVIAAATEAEFVSLNAVLSGVKDLKEVCTQAEHVLKNLQQRTVLFIDEIHRFNKAQQDALLPFVEAGSVILIGATTENPYFEVNAALVSRSHVHLLQPLSNKELEQILERALAHTHGYNGKITLSKEAIAHIATIANGDARIALNSLELAVTSLGNNISIKQAKILLAERSKRYDKTGEDHYNTISAFIKTMRGSDIDAALVWLFKMLASGEQPRFLFRRMAIFASEDIGNADPQALQIVMDTWRAFEFVGLPEGEYFLAQACVYLSQAPKSNAVTMAMKRARQFIATVPNLEVPNNLRNAPAKGMKQHGIGVGYQYPHDVEGGIVQEHYFPEGVEPQTFYEPTNRGFEAEVQERWAAAKKIIRESN